MTTLLGRAHAMCVHGDRILKVKGKVKGEWYCDRVLTYVNDHQFRMVEILEERDDQITVQEV